MLILTEYIAKHEFKPLDRFIEFDDVLDGANKVINGLAIETKSPQKLQGFRFFKVRIGKRCNARMIVFVAMENNKVVPILIRLKKDKIFGSNMAMNNPEVVRQINKNLDHILNDIENNRFQEFVFEA
jgi:hypothetical protein